MVLLPQHVALPNAEIYRRNASGFLEPPLGIRRAEKEITKVVERELARKKRLEF
jgi:hypothetical protein